MPMGMEGQLTLEGESVSWNSAKARRMSGLAWPAARSVSRRRRRDSGQRWCASTARWRGVGSLARDVEHVRGRGVSLHGDPACTVIAP
jgi:hypothetical protein